MPSVLVIPALAAETEEDNVEALCRWAYWCRELAATRDAENALLLVHQADYEEVELPDAVRDVHVEIVRPNRLTRYLEEHVSDYDLVVLDENVTELENWQEFWVACKRRRADVMLMRIQNESMRPLSGADARCLIVGSSSAEVQPVARLCQAMCQREVPRPSIDLLTDSSERQSFGFDWVSVTSDLEPKNVETQIGERYTEEVDLRLVLFPIEESHAFSESDPNRIKERLALSLPCDCAVAVFITRRVGLLTYAERQDLIRNLEEGSHVGWDYWALIFLSTGLASLGLVSDSEAVVIGAMVVAPLMTPILSGSMGLFRRDWKLVRSCLLHVLISVIFAWCSAVVMALVLHFACAWPESPGAMHTNRALHGRVDYSYFVAGMIAIFSGAAAGLATAKTQRSTALPGIAISVALIPPIAASGVFSMVRMLGTGPEYADWSDIRRPMLLVLINAMLIVVGSSMSFWCFGGIGPKRES